VTEESNTAVNDIMNLVASKNNHFFNLMLLANASASKTLTQQHIPLSLRLKYSNEILGLRSRIATQVCRPIAVTLPTKE
jgi:hypothetical protein